MSAALSEVAQSHPCVHPCPQLDVLNCNPNRITKFEVIRCSFRQTGYTLCVLSGFLRSGRQKRCQAHVRIEESPIVVDSQAAKNMLHHLNEHDRLRESCAPAVVAYH